jgi:hypothetical protein
MALGTRKWGCALGITLLIAVPVALAVWLGQSLMKPRSATDVMRSMPMYSGARDVTYTDTGGTNRNPMHYSLATVMYLVSAAPQDVLTFYRDRLAHEGWAEPTVDPTPLTVWKKMPYLSGFRLGGRIPWIRPEYDQISCEAHVEAEQVVRNGETFTQVTIAVMTLPGLVH